jgi:hypothetical protein
VATTPRKFTSICLRSRSIVDSSSVGLEFAIPALFTSASSLPCVDTTSSTQDSMDDCDVSSSCRTSIDTRAAAAAANSLAAPVRTVPTVVHPALAAAIAVARPIPDDAPVTSTTRVMTPTPRSASYA